MTLEFMEINLLPEEKVHEKYSFGIQVISFSLLSVLFVIFCLLGYIRLQETHSDSVTLQSETLNQNTLQNQINANQAQLNQQSMLQSFVQGSSNIEIRSFVNQVIALLPQGATYTDIHVAGDTVSVSGTVQSLHDVASYEDALAKDKQVESVATSTINSSNTNGLSFTAKLTLSGGNGQ